MSRVPVVAAVSAVFALHCFGQDFRATIAGQVIDQSGAAVPGAKMRAVQRDTNQATEAATNSEGRYTLPYLLPSTYDLELTAAGFRKMRRENITLMVAEKLELSWKLEVGEVTQEVTVTAEPMDLVQTADASGGLSFDSLMTSEYLESGAFWPPQRPPNAVLTGSGCMF